MTSLSRFTDPEVYTTEDGAEVVNLLALFRGLPPLLRKDITPIFVFDGEPHDRKGETIESRKEAKEQAKEKMQEAAKQGNMEEMRRYKAQTQSLTPAVHKSTREMLDRLGIPYVEAGGSGEAYAAQLVSGGFADAVLTDDYDSLLFGAPLTLRQYSGSGPAEAMFFRETLNSHEITHRNLVDIALLCGTDFNEGVSGIGPKRGVKKISRGKTVEEILENRGAEINGLEELRSIFLHPDLNSLPTVQPTLSEPNFAEVRAYAQGWDVPQSYISNNIERFPQF